MSEDLKLSLTHLPLPPLCLQFICIPVEDLEGETNSTNLWKIPEDLFLTDYVSDLDGRNRAIVITESLARVIAAIRIASVRWRSYPPPPKKHRNESSQTLRSLCCDSNRAIGVHSFNICSMWNCGMACECWPRSLNASDWRLAILPV